MIETRVIILKDIDDDTDIMLAKTNLTEEQIKEAVYCERYDEDNLDYEEKCEKFAEENNLFFERFYADEVIYV